MIMIAASAKIHPLALVEEGAVVGENVTVGPFCHVGPKVVLADDVVLLSHVVVTGRTTVGKGTRIFPNAVIGGDSQSVHHSAVDTELRIGANCTIREGVTMNTGTREHGGLTEVGDNNLFLAYAHVAHDCRLGSHIILSNNVMLAGHVTVEDRAILGGGSAVHQFTRIGRQAFVGGLSAVSYDVIPYGMLNGNPGVLSGLNVVGMTRAGFSKPEIHEVRRAYLEIFEGPGNVRTNAEAIRERFAESKAVVEILDFIAAAKDRALSSPHRGKKG
ncbi:acyl-ACP--UDP-N-acetylglucosamine O-acyltransferase [Rhizobium rhizosphaerae]|nr:acyl-ACP--UDP-N-acetylglucosamine O-acyltransferase [Xaviernesmea rhizosphaerae]